MRVVRKLIHLATAVVPAVGWLISRPLSVALAAVLLAASLLVEAARRLWPALNHLLWRLLPATFREWEHERVLGSTWFSLGMLAALLLFGRDVGGTAVLFLAWGDPVAEIVGRRWGQPGRRKTLAGSVGCFAACLVAAGAGIALGGLDIVAVLAGAIVATLVEHWSPPPDDNVWMPILSGLTIVAIQRLAGG